MQKFPKQILASTNLDNQGERLPLRILEGFAETYKGRRQTLNQSHDFSKPSPGHIENIHIVQDPNHKGEHLLCGDVWCDESLLEEVMRGYSISYTEMIKRSDGEPIILVYLPFPLYNDQSLIDELQPYDSTSVGKWVKKESDPALVGLLVAATVFIIKPIWDDVYKKIVAPKLYSFIANNIETFKQRELSFNLTQSIIYKGRKIDVIFIPIKGEEERCFSESNLIRGMKLTHAFVLNHDKPMKLEKIYLYFHDDQSGFKLHRTENASGETVSYLG